MNLIQQRTNGASIASIKHSIKNQLGGYWRAYRFSNLSQIRWHQEQGKALGKLIAQAINDGSPSMAMEAINNSPIRFSNTYEFFSQVFSENVVHCDDCNHLGHEDDTRTVDGEGYYCQSCLSAHYYWSNSEDRYVSEDDRDDDDGASAIGGYHSSKRRLGKIPSNSDRRKSAVFLGIELEIEIREGDCVFQSKPSPVPVQTCHSFQWKVVHPFQRGSSVAMKKSPSK